MNTFKSILWTVLGIVVFIAIIKFFIFLLPFIIVIGIVGYIVFKCKKAFNNKKEKMNHIIITIIIKIVMKKVILMIVTMVK